MPNHVIHRLYIHGDNEQDVKSFIRGKAAIDFDKIIPMPEELEDTPAPTPMETEDDINKHHELMQKWGASNWYDWRLSNWDTKWNAYEVNKYDNVVEFQTAWSTPYAIFVKLSELFPDVLVSVRYSDEDFGHNVGEFDLFNGEEVNVNQPEGGSREAYELAMEIQYGGVDEYYFEDDFIELYDDELTKYTQSMIDIAYDNNIFPYEDCNWHTLVLEQFKEKLMEDEKYEIVAIIQKELDKVEK